MRMARTIQNLTFIGSLVVGTAIAVGPATVMAAPANGVNKTHPPMPPASNAAIASARYTGGSPIVEIIRDHQHPYVPPKQKHAHVPPPRWDGNAPHPAVDPPNPNAVVHDHRHAEGPPAEPPPLYPSSKRDANGVADHRTEGVVQVTDHRPGQNPNTAIIVKTVNPDGTIREVAIQKQSVCLGKCDWYDIIPGLGSLF